MATSIFELPQEVLAQARPLVADVVEHLATQAVERLHLEEEDDVVDQGASLQQKREGGASTCIACGLGIAGAPGFGSVEEQRLHFRTDWHRYNVKGRVTGLQPVSEEQFAALIDRDDVGSLSGSESGDSDAEEESAPSTAATGSAGPQLHFVLPGGQQYAVWRCLVATEPSSRAEPPTSDAACLQQLQRLRAAPGSRWGVVLLRGGHFAAAVFQVPPPMAQHQRPAAGAAGAGGSRRQGAAHEGKWEALVHKSLHRYVVRAGQGGKQSSKDAGGKYARSAGSRLRRHNEAALERDIREALASWREQLAGCALLLVHAPSSNWATLFGGEAPPLDKADPRVRRIPFTTRRPTYSETKRVVRVLSSLYHIQPQPQPQPQPQQAAVDMDTATSRELLQQQQQQQQQPAGAQRVSLATAASPAASEHWAAGVADEEEEGGGAAGGASAAAEAAAAAEAVRKKAEKRARQKAKQREVRAAESAAGRAAAEEAASAAAEDEIARAAARAAALAARQQPKPGPAGAGASAAGAPAAGKASSAAAPPPPRLSAKPRADEDAAARRARAAAAAEARMKALQAASSQQQLY